MNQWSACLELISAIIHKYFCVFCKRLGFEKCSWQIAIIFCLMIHNTYLFLVLFNSMSVIMKVSKWKDSLITALFLSRPLDSFETTKTCPLPRMSRTMLCCMLLGQYCPLLSKIVFIALLSMHANFPKNEKCIFVAVSGLNLQCKL